MAIFKPNMLGHHVTRIDFAAHAKAGRVHWIFDVDRTLLPKGLTEVDPAIVAHLQRAREAGYIKDLTLVSNVITQSTELLDRLAGVARQLGIPSTHVFAAGFVDQKPRAINYRRAMAAMGSTPATTVMVGDQVFSDMLGANLLGIYTIYVWPLGKEQKGAQGDHPVTLLKRGPEGFLLWWWGFRRDT